MRFRSVVAIPAILMFSVVQLLAPFAQSVWQNYRSLVLADVEEEIEERIFIPQNVFQDLKIGDEIEWNGMRYDIINAEETTGGWNVIASADKIENCLLGLTGEKQNAAGKSSEKAGKIPDWINEFYRIFILQPSAEYRFSSLEILLQSGFLLAIVPPPEL